ncbi:MAG: hypothetical protein ACRDX8_07645 [Acidimicrobiales bacterium]
MRRYPVAVSAGAMALAWVRQEAAPAGAVVVASHELYPLDRFGRPWTVPSESTLACAVILRPALPATLADAVWLAGGLIALEGAEEASGLDLATRWPDSLVELTTKQVVGAVKADIQLGPGKVRSAVLTIRANLDLLGLGLAGEEALLSAILAATDRVSAQLDGATPSSEAQAAADPSHPALSGPPCLGPAAVADLYTKRCGLIGEPVRATLLPKGETRGYAHLVDETAALHIRSATGMVERVSINMLRALEVR